MKRMILDKSRGLSTLSSFSSISILSSLSIISTFSTFSRLSKLSKLLRLSLLSLLSMLVSCTIEPPLHLPQEYVETTLPITITDMRTVWGMEADLEDSWWYGWDDEDIRLWGKLEYPEPTYFEVRRYYQGEVQIVTPMLEDGFTIYATSFRRHYNFGYYNLLLWSNIDSDDGTQTVVINETDYNNIIGTTTKTTTSYANKVSSRSVPLKNQPEIFYNVHERDLYISRNKEDYDYYDPVEKSWVKALKTTLSPVVYIYLVQVVVYNNNGRIVGLADDATMQNMSEGVNLNTGHTLTANADVVYAMRMKNDLPAREGRRADIIGGKFTTFGLCDMEPWGVSRGKQYSGTRADLTNNVLLDIKFSNSSDAVFTYDLTSQIQKQAHGGILTIEIDADTITIPSSGVSSGSGFKPTVEEYTDSVTHEFGI